MAAKSHGKRRHVPQRTCVGCREVLAKRSLIRLVGTPEGLVIDPTSKLAGRGAYLHEKRSCWEHALKGPLSKALRIELSQKDRDMLNLAIEEMPEEQDG